MLGTGGTGGEDDADGGSGEDEAAAVACRGAGRRMTFGRRGLRSRCQLWEAGRYKGRACFAAEDVSMGEGTADM